MSKTTFQSVASEFYKAFTRDNPRGVWTLDGAPDWMRDVVFEAHYNALPCDWRYEHCRALVGQIEDYESADDAGEASHEIADGLVDVYNAALYRWLADVSGAADACDEAETELGDGGTMVARIQRGQYMMLFQMAGALIFAIESEAARRDDETADAEVSA